MSKYFLCWKKKKAKTVLIQIKKLSHVLREIKRKQRKGKKRLTTMDAFDNSTRLQLSFGNATDTDGAGIVHVLFGRQNSETRWWASIAREVLYGRRWRTLDCTHLAQHRPSNPVRFHLAIKLDTPTINIHSFMQCRRYGKQSATGKKERDEFFLPLQYSTHSTWHPHSLVPVTSRTNPSKSLLACNIDHRCTASGCG